MLKLFSKKQSCTDCSEKFSNEDELARHARDVHKHNIRKCQKCGKLFLNEKDRLHHIKEERQKEIEYRRRKNH